MKADILNRQFVSVFTSERNSPLSTMSNRTTQSVESIYVSHNGVAKLLRNLKPHKVTGPDGIPTRPLKETATEIAPGVSLLFQASSLDQGKVPTSWKVALVFPVFKNGNHSSNLRLPTTDQFHWHWYSVSCANILCIPPSAAIWTVPTSCQMHSMASGKGGHVKPSSCLLCTILLEAWMIKASQTDMT